MDLYVLSLPERVFRSASALAGGLVRELGEVTVPGSIRRTLLYRNMVDAVLRFMIEEIGQVEGTYPDASKLAHDFVFRKAAGHGLDWLGILAFRASPVWVMAALADLSGTGRHLIQEIADALKVEGLLPKDAQFETLDQMLDGLEHAAGQLTGVFNAPPLNVPALRAEWQELRAQVDKMPHPHLPTGAALQNVWNSMQREAAMQKRSVFQIASVMAVSAVSRVPAGLLWLTSASCQSVERTGELLAGALLNDYFFTLRQIEEEGFLNYWATEFRPYLRGAAGQFSPRRISLTQKLLNLTK